MYISDSTVGKGISIICHILILFIFLIILFFTFVSREEKNIVNEKLGSAIDSQTSTILDSIDKMDKKLDPTHQGTIDWSKVNDIGVNLQEKYKDPDEDISTHNKNLLKTSIIVSVLILLFLIGVIIYFKYIEKRNINIMGILAENVAVFVFVGIIEVLFFINIALKYVPLTTSDMATDIIDRTQYQINSSIV